MKIKGVKTYIIHISAWLSFITFVMQMLLAVGSWISSAINPNFQIRSMLGSDGLRWLFGTFVANVSSVGLVWILLAGIAIGTFIESRLLYAFIRYKHTNSYERMALFVCLWESACMIAVIILLAFIPHAILQSALGTLLPSSFSASIVPTTTFCIVIIALTYGYITGTFRSLERIFHAMCDGINLIAPMIIAYISGLELYFTVRWVFML